MVLCELVKKRQWTRGAELGVEKGILFEMLLKSNPQLFLIGVDVFPVLHRFQRCEAIAEQYDDRARLVRMTTHEASKEFPDEWLDFVFIDADHSEDAVLDDIRCWKPKVKPGGWLGGHDYNDKFRGVVRAVDQSFGKKKVLHYKGSIWGVKV